MSQNARPLLYDRVRPGLPWLIFVFAFGFRLIGIGWGLPNALHNQSYHPDEQVIFGYSQAIDPAHLQFSPGFYNYGTLYLTVLSVLSKMVASYGGVPKPSDLQSYWAFMGTVDLAGRIVSALAGAGTAVVLFLLLRRFTRVAGALAGGLTIAVAPAFVAHSRFQTVDVSATFFLALSLYNATRLLPATARDDPPNWAKRFHAFALLAGVFAGLSAGTKYTGILALLSLVAACALSTNPARWKAVGVGVIGAVAAFFLSTPGALNDTSKFLRDFKYEMWHTSTGHDLLFVDVSSGFIYHLVNLIIGIGILSLLLGFVGIGFALAKRQKWMFVLLAFSLVYYILIGRAEVLFLRYTFPLYIIVAAGFGALIGHAHWRQGRYRLLVAAGILGLGWSLADAGRMTGYMALQDPRDAVALELKSLNRNAPYSSVGLVSDPWYYTPSLVRDSAIMRGLRPRVDLQPFEQILGSAMTDTELMAAMGPQSLPYREMLWSSAPKVEQFLPPKVSDRFEWDTRLITELRPDYIVYSSFESYDVDRLQGAPNLDSVAQLKVDRYELFQKLLQANYVLIQAGPTEGFDPIPDMEYIHPILYLWKRKNST